MNELQELLNKKDQEMKVMEDRYKKYLEKAKSVSLPSLRFVQLVSLYFSFMDFCSVVLIYLVIAVWFGVLRLNDGIEEFIYYSYFAL